MGQMKKGFYETNQNEMQNKNDVNRRFDIATSNLNGLFFWICLAYFGFIHDRNRVNFVWRVCEVPSQKIHWNSTFRQFPLEEKKKNIKAENISIAWLRAVQTFCKHIDILISFDLSSLTTDAYVNVGHFFRIIWIMQFNIFKWPFFRLWQNVVHENQPVQGKQTECTDIRPGNFLWILKIETLPSETEQSIE